MNFSNPVPHKKLTNVCYFIRHRKIINLINTEHSYTSSFVYKNTLQTKRNFQVILIKTPHQVDRRYQKFYVNNDDKINDPDKIVALVVTDNIACNKTDDKTISCVTASHCDFNICTDVLISLTSCCTIYPVSVGLTMPGIVANVFEIPINTDACCGPMSK